MSNVTMAILLAGMALAVFVGLTAGLDAAGTIILVAIVGLGTLGLGAARKSSSGDVAPRECPECGGLVSPNAPYCKHCGTRFGG